MPSPFPGMDPFLEHPDVFPGLHHNLITFPQNDLQPALPEPYYATVEKREWIEVGERRVVIPDVVIRRGRGVHRRRGNGNVLVAADGHTQPAVVEVPDEEWHQAYLNIYRKIPARRLVTTIEILSLTNKRPGTEGRELYLRKQREPLTEGVNLVEIDLLRDGQHTTLVPEESLIEQAGDFDYHVCVRRRGQPGRFFIYGFQIMDALPDLDVPLLPEDPLVPLSLSVAFAKSYQAGAYRRQIDYADLRQIVPRLNPRQTRWARGLLRQQKLLR